MLRNTSVFVELFLNALATLYIEKQGDNTPKGDRAKNYFVCYPTFLKKETSCKEIRVSCHQLKILNRRFLMNEGDRTRLEEFRPSVLSPPPISLLPQGGEMCLSFFVFPIGFT
jgi:hypothetical protein